MPTLWSILLFVLASLLLLAPLVPAFMELARRTDAEPLQVSRQQDTNIRHFAHSFRNQLQEVLARYKVDLASPPASFEGSWKVDDAFQFVGPEQVFEPTGPEHQTRAVERMIVAGANLQLPGNLVYEREVFAAGKVVVGRSATLRALYGDTDVVLSPDCTIARWAHAGRAFETAADCRLFGRCSANSRMILQPGTRFERLGAPLILTGSAVTPEQPPRRDREAYKLPPSAIELDSRTSMIHGTIFIPQNSAVSRSLIATEKIVLGANSRIDGSIKAYQSIRIEGACVIRGAVVCEGRIDIDEGCIIAGPIIAEGEIRVGGGCVVGARALQTSVSAPTVVLTEGSRFSGTIWATACGQVVRPGAAVPVR